MNLIEVAVKYILEQLKVLILELEKGYLFGENSIQLLVFTYYFTLA